MIRNPLLDIYFLIVHSTLEIDDYKSMVGIHFETSSSFFLTTNKTKKNSTIFSWSAPFAHTIFET